VANTDDVNSINTMCAKSRLIINCVGPYILYGEPVVKSCITHGTDYIDVTGETNFIDKMVTKYHTEAVNKNVLIIPACGMDSIPTDLLFLWTKKQLQLPTTKNCIMEGVTKVENGEISHGTFATLLTALSTGTRMPPSENLLLKPRIHYNKTSGGYVFPFPVSDAYTVRRSHFLSETGTKIHQFANLEYEHYFFVGSIFKLIILLTAFTLLMLLSKISFTKRYLQNLNKPGDGPAHELNNKRSFTVTAETVLYDGKQPTKDTSTLVTRVAGGAPYELTAHVTKQAALILLQDRAKLAAQGGVVSPGFLMHNLLLEKCDPYLKFYVVSK